MLKRHIKEEPLDQVERRVRGQLHTGQSERQRGRIVRKRLRRTTVNLPRKLIEQDDQTEPPAGAVRPAIQLTLDCTLQEVLELRPDNLVLGTLYDFGLPGRPAYSFLDNNRSRNLTPTVSTASPCENRGAYRARRMAETTAFC